MGMIGNQIAAGQALTIANDSFNGDGSTVAFTLSQTVSSVNDIEVLVDNVQQSPYDSSYSVSGTTLTFSGAPATGTNNVYVIYNASRHITTQQVIPDDGSVTHSKFHTDALDPIALNSNYVHVKSADVKIQMENQTQSDYSQNQGILWTQESDSAVGRIYMARQAWSNAPHDMRFQTRNDVSSSPDRMILNHDGHLLLPYQPKFYVQNLNFPGGAGSGVATGGSVGVNIGSHYDSSNGRFTAPIAGTYQFIMMTQGYDSGNTNGQYQTAVFRKNGTNVGAETYHGWTPNDGNNHVQAQNTIIITLAASDYVQAYVQYGSRDIQNYFGGFLIG